MFDKRQLRVVESLRERTVSGTATLRSAPLASNNPIEFIWPRDADRHVAALAQRGCEQRRLVDVMIDDEMFAQIKWGSVSFGDEDGVVGDGSSGGIVGGVVVGNSCCCGYWEWCWLRRNLWRHRCWSFFFSWSVLVVVGDGGGVGSCGGCAVMVFVVVVVLVIALVVVLLVVLVFVLLVVFVVVVRGRCGGYGGGCGGRIGGCLGGCLGGCVIGCVGA